MEKTPVVAPPDGAGADGGPVTSAGTVSGGDDTTTAAPGASFFPASVNGFVFTAAGGGLDLSGGLFTGGLKLEFL